ncbi:UDP-N-acetylmuramoylalanyl-D-glutamate--2,6-diaminopimelate ligase [Candidatus Thiomargarita nelsonii]|uniref:UDP-N-acetylmuramoyl-L-alanyl-D-glutamate--2,6-diaminopimelate ligase n=1 Tax=Candidatus Thiomargarita nelsonii TaxID=1003181 RepID=A0A176RUD2_9GAMM|nr:UDP-N-acetylmuramoylalanyl-D-glutamate--2,6-diaminopimelate ligase [Candidatus Thiomargarita nelsonii]
MSMLLSQLLKNDLDTKLDRPVTGLALDSRSVRPGEVFLALAGTQAHGEIYIESALQKGAIAVLKEAPVAGIEKLPGDIPCISLPNLSQQLGDIAARFYGNPSRNMHIIGVTGTNGKTSVTHAIAYLLQAYAPCGLFGTLGYGIYGALQPGLHTTPDAIHLQALLAQLRSQNVSQVVMEVSSHALAQGRVNGISFESAVLTNLSRDHLDYHQTMTAYGDAKRRLFAMPHLKNAVINLDDAFGQSVLANLTVTPFTYSLHNKAADVYAEIRAYNIDGCRLNIHSRWGEGELQSPWFGQFNVSNVLAALTVLLSMGFLLPQLLSQLANLPSVPGRMERFGQAPTVIIDYAHTPDALEKTLLALREHLKGKMWCVFGCGGSRDRGKRRLMGEVAQAYADKVIITDDNPRHEASQAIIDDILQGCPEPAAVIPDRQQAIGYALEQAMVGDVVLIAGKGHEDYQEVGVQRLAFSDRAVVSELLDQ